MLLINFLIKLPNVEIFYFFEVLSNLLIDIILIITKIYFFLIR